jgi:hypothetical protein
MALKAHKVYTPGTLFSQALASGMAKLAYI